LMHLNPSDLGSLILIQITPKERFLIFASEQEQEQRNKMNKIAILHKPSPRYFLNLPIRSQAEKKSNSYKFYFRLKYLTNF